MDYNQIEIDILNKMIKIKNKENLKEKQNFLDSCFNFYGKEFNIGVYIIKNFEEYKIDCDTIKIFEKELKNSNLEELFDRLKEMKTNDESDKFKNIFCNYSIENLKSKKEENKENLKSILTQIGTKYGFQNLKYNDLKNTIFSDDILLSLRIQIDGDYGQSNDLKQTNKELFYTIINLIKNIKSHYIDAKESLDLKIENIKEYQAKIGLDIKDFKF